MKCEHCGKNEVSFVYQSNLNGKMTEKRLCSECAEQMGYLKHMSAHRERMMRSLFDERFFGGSLLEDFFAPMPGLMSRRKWMPESLFEDFFAEMPALNFRGGAKAEAPEQKQEELVSPEEQNDFSNQRKLNALRLEMKQAVEQEAFERAAQLRDQIRAMEADHQTQEERR